MNWIDQTVIELETDKEQSCNLPFNAGTVDSIVVKEGDIVKEGMIVVKVNSDDSSSKDTTTNSVPSSTSISAVSTPPSLNLFRHNPLLLLNQFLMK